MTNCLSYIRLKSVNGRFRRLRLKEKLDLCKAVCRNHSFQRNNRYLIARVRNHDFELAIHPNKRFDSACDHVELSDFPPLKTDRLWKHTVALVSGARVGPNRNIEPGFCMMNSQQCFVGLVATTNEPYDNTLGGALCKLSFFRKMKFEIIVRRRENVKFLRGI